MSVGWNINDSTTFLLPNISFLFFEQNDCTQPKCVALSEYTDSAHTEVEDPSSRCLNVSDEYDRCGHNEGNFILPAPPVGGLPISHDRLDGMKLVCNGTIPIILPSKQVERIYWLIQCLK